MKICLKCNRGLFDRDTACDKCGCTNIMDKREYTILYNTFQNSSIEEQNKLRKQQPYTTICKYKFIVDTHNTPEMRTEQSKRDKEQNLQQKEQYCQSINQRSHQIQTSLRSQVMEQPNIPKCPTCGSTDVQKLSTTSKVIGVGLLGLASKTVGKTYKCKHCGYYW